MAPSATKRIAGAQKKIEGRRQFCGNCGSTLVDGACPTCDDGPSGPSAHSTLVRLAAAGLVLVLILVALLAITLRARDRQDEKTSELTRRVNQDSQVIGALSHRISELEAKVTGHPDVATVAKRVQASVFTLTVPDGSGSSFVMQSAGGKSTLVTAFHVVASTWDRGGRQVGVKQGDVSLTGTIAKIDIPDDLALVTVDRAFPVLERAAVRPAVGDPVIVVGSPLDLAGTVTTGVVSAYRDNAVQFSAPISPGNSGGPVTDRDGRVIGVARQKAVVDGAEGLGFAVPIDTVCTSIISC